MHKQALCIVALLALATLAVAAETVTPVVNTITVTPPTKYTDGTTIESSVLSKMTYYFRVWKSGNPAGKVYLGELNNNATVWTGNIMEKANASINPKLVVGDNVLISASASYRNSAGTEIDGPEGTAVAHTIKAPTVTSPSCMGPSITVK